MSETGWPLIPRELLPAPIKRVRHPRPVGGPAEPDGVEHGRQLSIFGAETTEPSPADLAGLLAGPGRLDRMGGTARVRVPVDAGWRVHVLMNELVRRGLVVSWHPLASRSPKVVRPADPAAEGGWPAGPAIKGARPAANGGRPTGPAASAQIRARETADDADLIDYDNGWADEPASAVIGGAPRTTATPTETDELDETVGDEGPEAVDSSPAEDLTESDESGETDDSGESGAIAQEWHVPPTLFEVRTAYSSRLNAFARTWPEAADDLFLSGPRMRLWVAAAGHPAEDGFRLALSSDQDLAILEAALVRAGLAGSVADDRQSYLIMGERRLARLAELVGERPPEAPHQAWPGGARA